VISPIPVKKEVFIDTTLNLDDTRDAELPPREIFSPAANRQLNEHKS
jgi:hypothetical protein